MPQVTAQNASARGYDVTLLPATALTASGNTTGGDVYGADVVRCQVIVSAVSGTSPSVTVTIQTSHDNGVSDAWRTAATFSAITSASSSAWQAFVVDRYVRVAYAVSGTTPSLTTAVVGEAV